MIVNIFLFAVAVTGFGTSLRAIKVTLNRTMSTDDLVWMFVWSAMFASGLLPLLDRI